MQRRANFLVALVREFRCTVYCEKRAHFHVSLFSLQIHVPISGYMGCAVKFEVEKELRKFQGLASSLGKYVFKNILVIDLYEDFRCFG